MTRFAALRGLGRPAASLHGTMRPAQESCTPDDRMLHLTVAARQGALSICGDLGSDADCAQSVLSLWARDGERALDRLNGCFAFVLHDARSGETWAVRDRMGVRPMVYAIEADRVVLASTIGLVRAALSGPADIDRAWVADFLSGEDTSHARTAYAQIHRLPPGHLMRIAADGRLTTRAWYSLRDRVRPVRADGAEALRDALGRATREACAGRATATFLSGGLDSSTLSLLSLDGTEKRAALSLRYADPALDEGAYIGAVLDSAGGRLLPHDIPIADVKADLRALLASRDQPFFAPGLPGNRHLYAVARQMGYRDVLDGHGGDEVIDGSLRNIGHMAGQGAWGAALALGWQHARFIGDAPWGVWAHLVAARAGGPLAAVARRAMRTPKHDPLEWRKMVDPALAAETDLVSRVRARHAPVEGDFPESIRAHLAVLTAPLQSAALEVLDAAARSEGVTPHYPFLDHRVVELCAAQSDRSRIADGQPRSLLRRAMQGVLPEKVRLRRDKIDFMPDFWASLQRDADVRRLMADPQALQGWADIAALRADGDRLQNGTPDPGAAFRIARALSLSMWFESRRPTLQHET